MFICLTGKGVCPTGPPAWLSAGTFHCFHSSMTGHCCPEERSQNLAKIELKIILNKGQK